MSETINIISLSILGKTYQVKCPPEKISELRESAEYLEDKMRRLNQSGKNFGEKNLAIIAALNITHDLLVQKKQGTVYMDSISRRIHELQDKIDDVLVTPD
ncbi:MAG: cell division protein ZapA [Gammaproteobacteria bacterium]